MPKFVFSWETRACWKKFYALNLLKNQFEKLVPELTFFWDENATVLILLHYFPQCLADNIGKIDPASPRPETGHPAIPQGKSKLPTFAREEISARWKEEGKNGEIPMTSFLSSVCKQGGSEHLTFSLENDGSEPVV